MTTEIRFEPTLFIFLGTSAGQVGWRLKSMLQQAYGTVPVLRYLWVDADISRDDQVAQWFSQDEECVSLVGFNGDVVLANVSAYPAIQAWWPRATRLKPGTIHRGARQIRLYGRLALFRMFNDRSSGPAFIDKLRSAAEAIGDIESFDATERMSTKARRYIVERGSARIFIIFSTCGGTGSAIAFDVAYLCRALFKNTKATIIGVSMLPPVIDKAIKNETQVQWEKIRANTYAWFKEHEWLLKNPYWNVSYPEGAPVTIHATPFDQNFVVDIANQAGNRLNSDDDVFSLIAQAIFLDTGSSIGGAMRGFNANVSVLLEEFQGRQRAYSSLAAASLIYPAKKILNYCTARLSQSMIKQGLLAEPDPEDALEVASALVGLLRLRDTQLVTDLLAERQMVQLIASAIRKAEAFEKIRNLLAKQEHADAEERDTQCQLIADTAATILKRIENRLEKEISTLAIRRGIPFTLAVLATLTREVDARALVAETTISLHGFKARLLQQGVHETDLDRADQEYRKARERLRAMDGNPWQAIIRFLSKRAWLRTMDVAREDGLHWLAELNQITLQLAAQREAANIYDQLLHFAQQLRVVLAESTQAASRLAERFEQLAIENLKPATMEHGIYELALEVIGPEYIRDYYQRSSTNLDPSMAYQSFIQAIQPPEMETLADWCEFRLGEDLEKHARAYYAEDIQNTSLLEAVRQHHGPRTKHFIRAQFDRLVQHCHPFWQYNRDCGITGLEGKSIIGVEDEHSDLIPAHYRDNLQYELKSTGFKHEIHASRILHGLPAFLIAGMDEYKTYYTARRKGIDPLHVLPEAWFAEDVFPEEKQDARRLFAVAAAFGYLVQIGSWYYFDPNKEYAQSHIHPGRENQLAQGRTNAEDAFIIREDLVQQAERLIEREIVRMGNEAAIALLEEEIRAHKQALSRMPVDNELRHQVEKEIRALEAKQRQLGLFGTE